MVNWNEREIAMLTDEEYEEYLQMCSVPIGKVQIVFRDVSFNSDRCIRTLNLLIARNERATNYMETMSKPDEVRYLVKVRSNLFAIWQNMQER